MAIVRVGGWVWYSISYICLASIVSYLYDIILIVCIEIIRVSGSRVCPLRKDNWEDDLRRENDVRTPPFDPPISISIPIPNTKYLLLLFIDNLLISSIFSYDAVWYLFQKGNKFFGRLMDDQVVGAEVLTRKYVTLFYSILFYSILFYSILFYSIPFHSILQSLSIYFSYTHAWFLSILSISNFLQCILGILEHSWRISLKLAGKLSNQMEPVSSSISKPFPSSSFSFRTFSPSIIK